MVYSTQHKPEQKARKVCIIPHVIFIILTLIPPIQAVFSRVIKMYMHVILYKPKGAQRLRATDHIHVCNQIFALSKSFFNLETILPSINMHRKVKNWLCHYYFASKYGWSILLQCLKPLSLKPVSLKLVNVNKRSGVNFFRFLCGGSSFSQDLIFGD